MTMQGPNVRLRPEEAPVELRSVESYSIHIWIAGDLVTIREACRQHCMQVGLCVTVTATEFIYTGGSEWGAVVGVRHYPRFPTTREHLWGEAVALANRLMTAACQWSVMVEAPDRTEWFSRRDEAPEGGK